MQLILLTGSNMGHPAHNLQEAAQKLVLHLGQVTLCSSVFRTAPWGNTQQQVFLNQVLVFDTALTAEEILRLILATEKAMGRIRQKRWEPRIIDIDILFYDDKILHTPELQIPHPLIQERRFVLVPLNQILPNFVHPIHNKTITTLLAQCPDQSTVEKM
jgi:2-amino-4-hydroxy-6-hydroxymethyldihydropteridine diphosphokinase